MAVDNFIPLINGVAYTHADIVLNFSGAPVIGLLAINYKDEQAIEPNYSTGNKPTSVGFGQVEFEASITLSMEAAEAITAVAPNGRIQNIPFFSVGINYLPENQALVRHVLKTCKFKGRDQSSETGNSQVEVTIPLFISDINYRG